MLYRIEISVGQDIRIYFSKIRPIYKDNFLTFSDLHNIKYNIFIKNSFYCLIEVGCINNEFIINLDGERVYGSKYIIVYLKEGNIKAESFEEGFLGKSKNSILSSLNIDPKNYIYHGEVY